MPARRHRSSQTSTAPAPGARTRAPLARWTALALTLGAWVGLTLQAHAAPPAPPKPEPAAPPKPEPAAPPKPEPAAPPKPEPAAPPKPERSGPPAAPSSDLAPNTDTADRFEAAEPQDRVDSPESIPDSVLTPENTATLDRPAGAEDVADEVQPAPHTESLLPRHVGNPYPGEATLAVGVEDLVLAVDVKLALADWVRLDLQAQLDSLAPLIGAEVRFAAGGRHEGLWAHAFLGTAVRPVFGEEVFSGARFLGGLGLAWQWGRFLAAIDGGLLVGISFNPIDARERLADQVDQTGGLFALQRLELAVDLFDRIQLAGLVMLALPLDRLEAEPGSTGVLPEADVRLGARVAARF